MHTLDQLRSGALAGARRLDLACGLTTFPPEIFDLADSLEVLNLSGNALDQLPHDLGRLRHLRVIFGSDNRFTALPEVLGDCPALEMVGFKANRIADVPAAALPAALRWLILTDNAVASLPDALGARPRLQKLMLAGNRLTALPPSLAAAGRLELLRISANRFKAIPAWLAGLPRLTWLACGSNPALEKAPDEALPTAAAGAAAAIPSIDWSTLALGELLGEGASGAIYRAEHTTTDGRRSVVAVKLFKGAVTSDGLPQSEMAACMAAGLHPRLIGAQGRIVGHPDGRLGLVMPLVDPSFRVLAGPPSLASCTRDVYADDTCFTPHKALRIATHIAAAAAHLHARGIVHGDLYAHNILHDADGDALLGDFGAAWLPSPGVATQIAPWAQLEVRAFGCLLEELIDHGTTDSGADAVWTRLRSLRDQCLQRSPAARPDMATVLHVLAA